MKTRMVMTAALCALVAGAAHAETQGTMNATATTDLNIRSGPGPWYEVVGVIDADSEVAVEGCLEAENWCQVAHNGVTGWSYGDYLNVPVNEQPMALTAPETRSTVEVRTVTFDSSTSSTIGGAAFGTVAGALIGGPVGAAYGAAIGAGAGAVADPGPQITTYVTEHPVEPVYLEGEVVVGAGLPDNVELFEIPESEYGYTYVNGVPVIVAEGDRTIVRVVR